VQKPIDLRDVGRGAVLVTGAATGIGRATAELLCDRGHLVFAGVRRPADADALIAARPSIRPVVLDVTSDDARREVADEISSITAGAGLVGLVNNAGIAVQGPLETLDLADIVRQFDVNLFAVAATTQAMLPLLRSARASGARVTIVNIGSIGGRLAIPFNGAYNASKFALVGYTEALRQELRPWDLRVCLVEPGTTRTEIWQKVESSLEASMRGADSPYERLLARYRDAARRLARGGMPARRVAEVVAAMVSARRPAARKLVGDARLLALVAMLPTRLLDALMAAGLGLPGRGALSPSARALPSSRA
jgi:NAD(P)-dependent dehydrogenase (short-subunit alcohol dehydrogenase family)